jgi:hypothetical protein
MIKALHILESISEVIVLNERNVGNVPEIEDFVSEFVRAAHHPESQKWFKSTLRTYLINDYPKANKVNKKSVLRASGYYRPWMDQAIKKGEDIYLVVWDREFEDQMDHVLDYFNNLLDNRENLPRELQVRDLTRLSVEDAIRKSEDWTEWLSRGTSVEDDTGTKTLMKMSGYTWVEVLSAEALNYEGQQMGHCVGSYASRVQSQNCQIYSLRDSKNEPHVTIEARGDRVIQIKGKQNKEVVEKYWDYVADFLTKSHLDASGTSDLKNIGMYYQDGKVMKEPGPEGYYEVIKRYPDHLEWIHAISPRAKNLFASKVIGYSNRDGDVYVLIVQGGLSIFHVVVSGGKIVEAKNHKALSSSGEETLLKSKLIDFMNETGFEPGDRKVAKLFGGIPYKGRWYFDEKELPPEYWDTEDIEEAWNDIFYVSDHQWEDAELPNIEEVERLLTLGVKPDRLIPDIGMTPMQVAYLILDYHDYRLHKDCMNIVEILLEHGADINARDKNGATILHYAASSSHDDIEEDIGWFISKGAKTDARDNSGQTPLEWSINGEREWNATTLISNGAEATEQQKKEVVDLFIGNYESDVVKGIADDIGYEYTEEEMENWW